MKPKKLLLKNPAYLSRIKSMAEVWRQPKASQAAESKTYGPRGLVTSEAVPQFTLDLEALFAASGVAERP